MFNGYAFILGWSIGFGGSVMPAPAAPVGPDTSCVVMDMPTDGRLSPLDSLTFLVQDQPVKICYGRPSARGRTMIGGRDVPYGALWRTGANEPTMIHTTLPVSLGGIEVGVGSHSMYTIPGEEEWVVIVNRSITQWGHISRYTYKVKKAEVGRATVQRERMDEHVETLTFRAEVAANGNATLIMEWEHTRVRIPIAGLQAERTTGRLNRRAGSP